MTNVATDPDCHFNMFSMLLLSSTRSVKRKFKEHVKHVVNLKRLFWLLCCLKLLLSDKRTKMA